MDENSKGASSESLSAFTAFVLGAVSKSIATFLTYPAIRSTLLPSPQLSYHSHSYLYFNANILIQRCKVMIQAADPENGGLRQKTNKSLSKIITEIWRTEGLLGFFKGIEAQILKTVLSSALLLMIKEKISKTTWVLILAIRRSLLLSKGRIKSA